MRHLQHAGTGHCAAHLTAVAIAGVTAEWLFSVVVKAEWLLTDYDKLQSLYAVIPSVW